MNEFIIIVCDMHDDNTIYWQGGRHELQLAEMPQRDDQIKLEGRRFIVINRAFELRHNRQMELVRIRVTEY